MASELIPARLRGSQILKFEQTGQGCSQAEKRYWQHEDEAFVDALELIRPMGVFVSSPWARPRDGGWGRRWGGGGRVPLHHLPTDDTPPAKRAKPRSYATVLVRGGSNLKPVGKTHSSRAMFSGNDTTSDTSCYQGFGSIIISITEFTKFLRTQ